MTDPAGALKQFKAVTKRSDALTVVGIAGPGDALANPKATFSTLKQIHQHNPDVQLCISTNGLMLAEYVDELAALGVNHLTITINCIDPEIGTQIYPWIYYDNKRMKGLEAATTLIRRQLEGLELAANAGMLIKVNTVLIPGVNDHHIEVVAKEVHRLGAMLHNIMPLISEPEHGTYFGLNGYAGPNDTQLSQAREDSAVYMPQMTHCQQCRADAVGTLGEPCHTESTDDSKSVYRIAIAAMRNTDNPLIATHFGYAEQFDIYDFNALTQQFTHHETRVVAKYCRGPSQCDEQEQQKQQLLDALVDVNEVLCSRIGITPWRQLEKQGVKPNVDFALVGVNLALEKIASQVALSLSNKELTHVRDYG
ncbi:nitrogen fixation protein NifB [Vibrio sp. 10N.286.49.B3]|nr:nitrogen fixation protein NifB [Vibrio sp. 10N.286.49.B3]